ncbi:MAG: transposase [Rhodospirillaceae bacterium]
MPHKVNVAQRQGAPHPKRRVTNWKTYDASLRQRGSLTIWFTEETIAAWRAELRTTCDDQPHYSVLAISTALTLRAVCHFALRQIEWLIGSVLYLLGLDLPVPDHTTLGRRAKPLQLPAKLRSGNEAICGEIIAAVLIDCAIDDASQVGVLLDQMESPLASCRGDGAYDRTEVYVKILRRDPEAKVVVPPRSDAVLSDTAVTAPMQRNRHIYDIAVKGRSGWQATRKYNRRTLVEAQIGRYKTVIGEALRSHTDEAQATEVNIVVLVLNRMLDLGHPESMRAA